MEVRLEVIKTLSEINNDIIKPMISRYEDLAESSGQEGDIELADYYFDMQKKCQSLYDDLIKITNVSADHLANYLIFNRVGSGEVPFDYHFLVENNAIMSRFDKSLIIRNL